MEQALKNSTFPEARAAIAAADDDDDEVVLKQVSALLCYIFSLIFSYLLS